LTALRALPDDSRALNLGPPCPPQRRLVMRAGQIPTMSITMIAALLIGATTAQAALKTGGCLAKKSLAQGKLRQCLATANAKALQGKPADFEKCGTKFQEQITSLNEKARKAGIECRYVDNGNDTVTDYDTGLQWEMKNNLGGGANLANPHDADNGYDWTAGSSAGPMSGTAFTDFLSRLNNCGTPKALGFATVGFAFHCDWRLPTRAELLTIVDTSQGFCGGGSGACINPIFGPTSGGTTWSSTTIADSSFEAWAVAFSDGGLTDDNKLDNNQVRAVRGGL